MNQDHIPLLTLTKKAMNQDRIPLTLTKTAMNQDHIPAYQYLRAADDVTM